MNKAELAAALGAHNVQFHSKATVAELRSLYSDTIGKEKETATTKQGEGDNGKNQNEQTENSEKQPNDSGEIDDTAKKTSELNIENSDDQDQKELDDLLLRIPKTPAAQKLHDIQIEEELLDAQIRLLEKKKRVFDLEASMQTSSQATTSNIQANMFTPIAQHIFKPTYKDIKHLVPLFSGSDDYDANKWIVDFERACDALQADDVTKLKFFRQSMKSESVAELFLHTDSSAKYSEIRASFLKNFGFAWNVGDVIDRLRKTTFDSANTTVMGYILKMQQIASRVEIEEKHVVQIIVEGFKDKSPHIAVLYPATTFAELKEFSHRYAKLRELSPAVQSTSGARPKTKTNISGARSGVTSGASSVTSDAVQCFNCSGFGHFSRDCTAPKRNPGSCFRCGSSQHKLPDCPMPKPTPTNNRVALITSATSENVEQSDRALSEVNTVSVTFLSECSVHISKDFVSLFDSGSPISLIKYSAVPKQLTQHETMSDSGYNGIGRFKICTYGVISVQIKFRNICKRIKIFVIPDNFMSHSVLLGRNFMRAFGIRLSIETVTNNIPKPKIEINVDSKRNKIRVSNQTLHCVYGSFSDKNLDFLSECELCRRLPNACIANCDSVSIANPVETSNAMEFENSIDYIDETISSISEIMTIDIGQFSSESFDINPKLNVFHRGAIEKIIQNDYLDLANIPPIEHDYKVNIQLTSDVPISFRPRRLSYSDKQLVDKLIDDLLKRKIIRPSNSPYAFPIVLPSKKDGTKRMCVDYKSLNKIMVRSSFPLPLIDDCLERMEGKRYFTILDLKNGFHQVKMAEDSVQYTAFVVPSGQYEYNYLPFGLKIGPGIFQKFINWLLNDFIREGSVVSYMDDFTLATKTIPEHLDLLKRVLRRLAEFRLEINPDKCKFCYSEIDLLGFTINSKGARPNGKHLEAVRNMKPPRNVDHVNKILGLFSYFRRFIKSYSTYSAPIRQLTKNNVPFEWTAECQRIFENLKTQLTSTPILAIYNPTRETELHCDACSKGYGGILLQRQDDGKMHPTAYFSKSTSSAESVLHSYELETLAIVYSLQRFETYLGIPFTIVTDCEALVQTMNMQKTSPKIARWSLYMQKYDFKIKHRSGTLMGHVDTLSRYPIASMEIVDCSEKTIALIDPTDIDLQLQIFQNRDENIVQLRESLEKKNIENFVLEDGLVYRQKEGERALLYVPKEMETNIIRQAHDKTCHMGISKCVDQIQLHYWFPKMRNKVEHFVRNCIQCAVHTVPPHCSYRTLHNIPKKPIPFDTIHVDHFGPLPSLISKKKHILVIVDSFTKHVKLYACNTPGSKEVITSLESYIEYYSRPKRLIGDRGTAFTSSEFESYLSENNIEHVKNATCSPQANGQVERVNRIIKAMLAKISEPIQHSDWHKLLRKIEFAINNSVHSSTKQTPSRLLFGVHQRGKDVDVLSEFMEEKLSSDQSPDFDTLRSLASENIEKSQKRNLDWNIKNRKPHIQFQEGDYVLIRNVDTTIGTNKKFVPKFRGPYQVHKILPNDRYVIRDIENCQITQIPYDGIIEASRIRKYVEGQDTLGVESDSEE